MASTATKNRKAEKADEAQPELGQAPETEGAVATRPTGGALALPMEDLLADAGSGLEEVTSEDIAVPYLSILQKQSKLLDQEGFEGKPGQFVHTITKECFDGQAGIDVIPCHFRAFWREITGDTSNPKFIAEHPRHWPRAKGAEFRPDLRRHVCHDGTHANQILRFYCLLVGPVKEPEPVCLTFKGSQIKAAKNWNSMLSVLKMEIPTEKGVRKIQAPTWASIWNLRTVHQSNDDGAWYGYELRQRGLLDPMGNEYDAQVYVQGREFHEMVAQDLVSEVGEDE